MLQQPNSQSTETINVQAEVQVSISKREYLREIMREAHRFIKIAGVSLSDALKKSWALFKLKVKMRVGIVKFYYQKVDMSMREAYGTLCEKLMPEIKGNDNRKRNETVFVYYDTERAEYRCFKKLNLVLNPLNV